MSNKEPLVSVMCQVFNHAPLLEDCLRGFINQKVNFPFEVLIHDDASTDNSQEIIRKYEQEYPHIFKSILQVENQYSQGKKIWASIQFPRAQGKYIALCEGDDYWTDPNKLQKQVDFMEAHPDYSMCFHNAMMTWTDGYKKDEVFAHIEDRQYSIVELYRRCYIPTASMFMRTSVVKDSLYTSNVYNPKVIYGDIFMCLVAASLGKVWGMHDNMSVYRKHPGGMIYRQSLDRQLKEVYMDAEFKKFFPDEELGKMIKQVSFWRSFEGYIYSKYYGYKDYIPGFKACLKKNFAWKHTTRIPLILWKWLTHLNKYKENR
ncbi:glycosyltransferase family 2 protein [Bacteroides coprosuis]|uniref:glycosyltransferase family 2 protein n=1 Tax=Bacteroides coprosuis TaxID=151276 RepID=UPI001DC13C2D|nr:glycosyltransferase [Bacteroides coprosuis]HJD92051.1 glycosyltransferase [Bacteroides coprosuis]